MTDDFLTIATDTTDTIKTLLQKAELLKAHSEAFERGEVATLTLRFGETTIIERDLKADIRGEMVKAFFREENECLLAKIGKCVNTLYDALKTEEIPH